MPPIFIDNVEVMELKEVEEIESKVSKIDKETKHDRIERLRNALQTYAGTLPDYSASGPITDPHYDLNKLYE